MGKIKIIPNDIRLNTKAYRKKLRWFDTVSCCVYIGKNVYEGIYLPVCFLKQINALRIVDVSAAYYTIYEEKLAKLTDTEYYESKYCIFFNRAMPRHKKEFNDFIKKICIVLPDRLKTNLLYRKMFICFRIGLYCKAYDEYSLDLDSNNWEVVENINEYAKKIANLQRRMLAVQEEGYHIIAPLQGGEYSPGWECLAIFWALLWANAPFTKEWHGKGQDEFALLIDAIFKSEAFDKICYPGMARDFVKLLSNKPATMHKEKEYIAEFTKYFKYFNSQCGSGEAWIIWFLHIKNKYDYWYYLQRVYNAVKSDLHYGFYESSTSKVQDIKEILSTIHLKRSDDYYKSIFTARTLSEGQKSTILSFIFSNGSQNLNKRKERLRRLIELSRKQAFFNDISQLSDTEQRNIAKVLSGINNKSGVNREDYYKKAINGDAISVNSAFELTVYYAAINKILDLEVPKINNLSFIDYQLSSSGKEKIAQSKRRNGKSGAINLSMILRDSADKMVDSRWEDYSFYANLFNVLKYPNDLSINYKLDYDTCLTYLKSVIDNHIWFYKNMLDQLK